MDNRDNQKYLARERRYHWRANSSFSLLEDSVQFYPRMLNSISKTKKNIFFKTYFIESGSIADLFTQAIIEASKRGVEVFVVLTSIVTF